MANFRKLFCLVVLVAVWGGSTFAANVTLAWNPSSGSTVAGYDIYYWVAKSVHTNEISVGQATSVTISNLQVGITYDFAAATISILGLQSRLSAAIAYTVPKSTPVVYPNNHPPTLNAINNLEVYENVGWQKVRLSGITSGAASEKQKLTVTAVSSNTGLVHNPNVIYSSPNQTGILMFVPVVKTVGITTITVTVNDGGVVSNIVTQSFTILVVPNGPPPSGPPIWNIGSTTEVVSAASVPAMVSTDTTSANSRAAVVVANPAASLAVLASYATGQFAINVTGATGQSYAVQASTDLVNWVALQTNTAPFTFTDTDAGQFSQRFYRAVYAP